MHPDAVQRRLGAEADLLLAPCPPDLDVSKIYIDDDDVEIRVDVRWKAALKGLRAFLANGHGAEAEGLGWTKDELYATPPVWARVDLRGVGLLIGDAEVVEISATRIQIKTTGGATQSFYRRPEPDLALVFRTNYEIFRRDFKHEDAEPLAYDRTVAFHQSRFKSDLATAKARRSPR